MQKLLYSQTKVKKWWDKFFITIVVVAILWIFVIGIVCVRSICKHKLNDWEIKEIQDHYIQRKKLTDEVLYGGV